MCFTKKVLKRAAAIDSALQVAAFDSATSPVAAIDSATQIAAIDSVPFSVAAIDSAKIPVAAIDSAPSVAAFDSAPYSAAAIDSAKSKVAAFDSAIANPNSKPNFDFDPDLTPAQNWIRNAVSSPMGLLWLKCIPEFCLIHILYRLKISRFVPDDEPAFLKKYHKRRRLVIIKPFSRLRKHQFDPGDQVPNLLTLFQHSEKFSGFRGNRRAVGIALGQMFHRLDNHYRRRPWYLVKYLAHALLVADEFQALPKQKIRLRPNICFYQHIQDLYSEVFNDKDYPRISKRGLQGAKRQNLTEVSEAATTLSQVRAHFKDRLIDCNVPPLIAASVSLLFASVICSLVALFRTPKKHRSPYSISSLILQIVSLFLQIIHLAFAYLKFDGIEEFVTSKVTALTENIFPIMEPADLRNYVIMRADSIEAANEAIKTFSSRFTNMHVKIPLLSKKEYLFSSWDHSTTVSPASYQMYSAWLSVWKPSVSYWLCSTYARLWKLSADERLFFDNLIQYYDKHVLNIAQNAFVETSEDDHFPEIQPPKKEIIVDDTETEIENETPTAQEFHAIHTVSPPVIEPSISPLSVHSSDSDVSLSEFVGKTFERVTTIAQVHVSRKENSTPPTPAPRKLTPTPSSSSPTTYKEMLEWERNQPQKSISPNSTVSETDIQYQQELWNIQEEEDWLESDSEESALEGAQRQMDSSTISYLSSQIIALLCSIAVAIVTALSGKVPDFGLISRNWQGVDFLGERFSAICEKLSAGAGKKTEEEVLQEKVQMYLNDANECLKIPQTVYASRADLRASLDKKTEEIEAFIKMPCDPKKCDKSVLSSLFIALNSFRLGIHRAQYDQSLRQEPRMFLFYGGAAVGKTKTMQNLAAQIGKEMYAELDPNRRSIALTARSKYFPLLNGEPIWMVDEIGASVDYADELVLRDVRGLCSSARFGADTAEIAGKNQTAQPHLIMGTLNTHPNDVMERIANLCGTEAVEPCDSRIQFILCTRNVEKYGPLNPAMRDTADCDKSGKMEHVCYQLFKLNTNTWKYEVDPRKYRYSQIKKMITNRLTHLANQHVELVRSMEGASQQGSQSRTHFVVNLHGLPRAGKGRSLDHILPELRKYTGYAIVKLDQRMCDQPPPVFQQRCIVIADDFFAVDFNRRSQQERWWMDFYNNSLVSGSIILIATNIIPRSAFPHIELLPDEIPLSSVPQIVEEWALKTGWSSLPWFKIGMAPKFSLPVSEPGFLRRIGFTGRFVNNSTSDTDLSFLVRHDVLFEQAKSTLLIPVTQYVSIIPIVFCFSWWAFGFLVSLPIFGIILYGLQLYLLSSCTKKIDKSQLFQHIFKNYQRFLTVEKEVCVQFAPIQRDDNLVLEVHTTKFEHLVQITPTNIPTHIFSNRARFEASILPWKIWISPTAGEALLSYASRFTEAAPAPSVESVVDFMKTLRHALANAGISANMLVRIGDLGTFHMSGNVISVDRRLNGGFQYDVVPLPHAVGIIPAANEECDVVTHYIPWQSIVSYHVDKVPIVDLEAFPIDQVKFVVDACLSPDILLHPSYIEARARYLDERVKSKILNESLIFRDKFQEFAESLTGKVCIGCAAALVSLGMVYGIYSLFKTDKKKKIKQQRVEYVSSQETSSSESDFEEQKYRNPRTGRRKQRPIDSLSPNKRVGEKRKKRGIDKLSPQVMRFQKCLEKSSFQISEPTPIPQSIDSLPDMNGYDEFKNQIGALHEKVKKNECWVVTSPRTEEVVDFGTISARNSFLQTRSRCYGLFTDDHNFITVGHMYKECKKYNHNLYVSCDNFGTKIFKATLVKSLYENHRDLSFWTIPPTKESKKIPAFTHIRKHFIKKLSDMPEFSDCIVKRYAEHHQQQFLYANMLYEPDEISANDANGDPYKLRNYGMAFFSFCLLALTTNGDCGLPYYNIFRDSSILGNNKQIKITGIHCMGNVQDSTSLGIAAIVSQEDLACFNTPQKPENESETECNKCSEKRMRFAKPLPEKDMSDDRINHQIVWNSDHQSNVPNMLREMEFVLESSKEWIGTLRKSNGASVQSHPHSHLHAIEGFNPEFDHDPRHFVWYQQDSDFIEGQVLTAVFNINSLKALSKWFADNEWINEFILWYRISHDLTSRKGKQVRRLRRTVRIEVMKHSKTAEEIDILLKERPTRQMRPDRWVPPDLEEILDDAVLFWDNGDVPELAIDNQTWSVLGGFNQNKSLTPDPGFERIKFSQSLMSPIGKVPFNANAEEAPEEQYRQLVFSRQGELSARVTQSVQWQGRVFAPSVSITSQVMQLYYTHIQRDFSNLNELKDKEVLHGECDFGLNRLELAKSIGFSMSSLFHVQSKADVLNVDENGKYTWLDNEAAKFAQKWYKDAKACVRNGKVPGFFYLELCKMEKLKPEKNFLGRIFCAADLVDILIQRKFLGSFLSRTTTSDNTVGVGSDPFVVFHNMARNCIAKGNCFTGDYKRWDKTVPRWLFVVLGKMLDRANPQNAHFLQLFDSIACSMHVSGHTLFIKKRGMASGAAVTANLNSKLNDLALFTVFFLLGEHRKDITYELYDKLVYRKFYGDDVIIAVDSSIAPWFNMETVRTCLAQTFGFQMDSSEKDGKIQTFMPFNELSWCSRYFRKLDQFDYYVGALKKVTITSMLHWQRKGTDMFILAAQLNCALYEAAAWEEEFFDQIFQDISLLRQRIDGLSKYLVMLSRLEYQEEMYTNGMRGNLIRRIYALVEHLFEDFVPGISSQAEFKFSLRENNRQEGIIDVALPSREIFESLFCLLRYAFNPNKMGNNITVPPRVFSEEEISRLESRAADYVSLLNVMHQAGKITAPEYVYTQQPDLTWVCCCTCRKNEACSSLYEGCGIGQSKKVAKQQAAYEVYYKLNAAGQFRTEAAKKLNGAKQEMNMSPPDQVPKVKTSGMDMSLTAGSHVFSNTQFAQGAVDLNPTAFSLNNIAQSGAPFDIKDSVYNIFQLESSTTITSVQGVGSEVFRLSLDPKTRPQIHQNYIRLHAAHCPSVEFGVYINGTAGALGTIKIGWVRDISKASYSLADIQQIASQDVSLGQSSTVNFIIRDIRKGDMYRDVENDKYAYPGVVALVSNPISNVQRNEAVSYPIQIYSRLAPDYILGLPLAIDQTVDNSTSLALDAYITISTFDIAINQNNVTNGVSTVEFPDCGWNTGNFNPTFDSKNLIAVSSCTASTVTDASTTGKCVATVATTAKLSVDKDHVLDEYVLGKKSVSKYHTPVISLYFGYGNIPDIFSPGSVKSFWKEVELTKGTQHKIEDVDFASIAPHGTVYTIPEFSIRLGNNSVVCNQAMLYEGGIILKFSSPVMTSAGSYIVAPGAFKDVTETALNQLEGEKINGNFIIEFHISGEYTSLFFPTYLTNGVITHYIYGYESNYVFPCLAKDQEVIAFALPVPIMGDAVPMLDWRLEANFPSLYQMTFLATGNQATTVSAPSGFVRLFFVRPGTTLNSAIPINAPEAPGVLRLIKQLNRFQQQKGATWLQMTFQSDAITNDFQLIYNNGIFLCRTSATNQIRYALESKYCLLSDIRPISSTTQVTPFTPTGWSSWIAGNQLRVMARDLMNGMQLQAGLAEAAIAGGSAAAGLFQGIANGVFSIYQMKNQNAQLEQNRQLQMALMRMQTENQLRIENQRFNNQLALRGMTGASANTGNTQTFSGNSLDRDMSNYNAALQAQRAGLDPFGPSRKSITSINSGISDVSNTSNSSTSSESTVALKRDSTISNPLNPDAKEFVPGAGQHTLKSEDIDPSNTGPSTSVSINPEANERANSPDVRNPFIQTPTRDNNMNNQNNIPLQFIQPNGVHNASSNPFRNGVHNAPSNPTNGTNNTLGIGESYV